MSLTVILIVITVGISFYAWNNAALLERWMLNPYQVSRRGEYWRMLSSGFIHADWGHLAFNMISLYSFGEILEQVFPQVSRSGSLLLLVLYLVGIVVSDIPTFLQQKNNSSYNSLGASGGVSAVVFCGILFFPMMKLYLFFIPIGIPGWIFGGIYLAYSFYESRRGGGYINHSAHLWGALFGIAFAIIIYPPVVWGFIEQVRDSLF